MYFDTMPELRTTYGYFVVIAVIVGTCSYLYYRFKKSRWL
jgi:magnesium transporter